MSIKLITPGYASPAERRSQLEREATLELRAYRRTEGCSVAELSHRFGCSTDSIERYLTGARPVPGYIVLAIRDRRAA